MNVTGLVVCVQYADLLARGFDRWVKGCDRLVVVTAPGDSATLDLCAAHGIAPHVTDVFYQCGAKFNKGAAMAEAAQCSRLRSADWILSFDADIVPPETWRRDLEACKPMPGNLYGCWRYQVPENGNLVFDPARRMPQGWVIGFFTLFHATDPCLSATGPMFDICWPHAGNYDTEFTRRWPMDRQKMLPLPMIHLGEERQNWTGRGRREELRKILAARGGRPNNWHAERMAVLPHLKGF
jgi:hypothetical protein